MINKTFVVTKSTFISIVKKLCMEIKRIQKNANFFITFAETLHKKWSFPLMISLVNVTKSAVYCGFAHIYWRNP